MVFSLTSAKLIIYTMHITITVEIKNKTVTGLQKPVFCLRNYIKFCNEYFQKYNKKVPRHINQINYYIKVYLTLKIINR